MNTSISADSKTSSLVVFVHVPKTGGTTINSALEKSSLVGHHHIEHWLLSPHLAMNRLASLDWVSGHIAFPNMRDFLSAATPRPLRFFSIIRLPAYQICSHYNWLIEIFHKGEAFYSNHPQNIKEISENIRKTDNTRTEAVIEQIKAAPGLFLNQQSRFLIGEDVQKLSKHEVSNRLAKYEYVAMDHDFSGLIGKMIGTNHYQPTHENKSRYHFDRSVFNNTQMQAFLAEYHKADQDLYEMIRTKTSCGYSG